ncbi:MAG: VCBS repeat-containing protein [Deltaproteobacteria bacterium]|nr:VCBS repeat-containing protein [Deltaproteobacteria bacterium]
MNIFRDILICGRTHDQRADAPKTASGSSIRLNVVESGSIVSHSRAGGNLFAFGFKHIKWIPAFAGMARKSKYLHGFIKPITNVFHCTVILLLMLTCINRAFASIDFVASEIDTGENRQGYWNGDMNGDGLQDIIIATWSEANGREFLIYTQETSGNFSGAPWRRIEIKKDIVAFALADLRTDPGSEFLLFTGSACYSLSCIKEGYTGNLKKLFEFELIKSVPDKKAIDFLGALSDLNSDSLVDILIPGQKNYFLFKGQPDEGFSKPLILPEAKIILKKSKQGQNNLSIGPAGVSAGGQALYANLLISKLQPETLKYPVHPPILNSRNWIPGVSTGRFNSDELHDFIYLDDIESDNKKRVNVVYQLKTDELPSVPSWQGELTLYDTIKMMEVNGDRLMDIITVKMSGLNSILYIFLNKEGRFVFDKPDHIIKLTGILSDFEAIDLNLDGYPELIINTYYVSPLKAVSSGSVERRLLIFKGRNRGEEKTLFDRTPAFTYDENFTATNFKALTGERSFSGDFDGDGVNDVISIDNNGALNANRINRDLKLEAEPLFRFSPVHFITGKTLVRLNQDNRTDIILEHQQGLSLILSRKGALQ